eukprot:GCRY01000736.1.p1 GENE.GCRY01000736.1~~GCRY01000736.1.p1  ORF type:complete len:611 (-),score=94.70 GCRY01000736.1:51-1820(-)
MKIVLSLFFGFLFCSIAFAERHHIALQYKQKNLKHANDLLSEISDIRSPYYGQHLSLQQVTDLFGSDDNTIFNIVRELRKTGAVGISISSTKDFIECELPSQSDLSFLKETFSNEVSSVFSFAPEQLSLDNEHFIMKKKDLLKTSLPLNRISGDPNNQKKAYGIPEDLVGTNSANSQMVWGTGTFGYDEYMMQQFYDAFNISESLDDISHMGFRGRIGGDNFGEGTLDTTYTTGMAVGVHTIVANTNNAPDTEWSLGFGRAFLEFSSNISQSTDIPKVLSLSLGSLTYKACDLLCSQLDPSVMSYPACKKKLSALRQVCMYESNEIEQRIDAQLLKLTLRGTTILSAAGDGGSHYSFVPFDASTEFGRALNKIACQFSMPTYPSASPYVLSIGGIQWTEGMDNPVPWIGGGSGFSWIADRPSWQDVEVKNYLGNATLPSGFNAHGRAYPDVSCLADNTPMPVEGKIYYAGGTSAAAPSFAGVLSLINDARFNKGLPSLGFVNPRLYQLVRDGASDMFYDVTVGNSNCPCSGLCCCVFFPLFFVFCCCFKILPSKSKPCFAINSTSLPWARGISHILGLFVCEPQAAALA